ncbi:MAG: branched-chain amino acid ABC transporter permease, partial [Acidimicrobiales bacterium]
MDSGSEPLTRPAGAEPEAVTIFGEPPAQSEEGYGGPGSHTAPGRALPVQAGPAAARLSPSQAALSRPGLAFALLVVIVMVFFPQMVQSTYVVSVAMQVEILACLALGLNFVVGYAGMLDLGFAAFFAIGAYTTGLLSVDLGWPVLATIPPAVAAALLGAVFIGMPTLRLRSDYLAIVTLGFGEIIQN